MMIIVSLVTPDSVSCTQIIVVTVDFYLFSEKMLMCENCWKFCWIRYSMRMNCLALWFPIKIETLWKQGV